MKGIRYYWLRYSLLSTTLTFLVVKYLLKTASGATPTIATTPQELVPGIFCPIINWMFTILMAIAVIVALWAAYTYITAGDDTEKTTKARKLLTYAAIGIVVALIANGFPYVVGGLFTATGGNLTSTTGLCGS